MYRHRKWWQFSEIISWVIHVNSCPVKQCEWPELYLSANGKHGAVSSQDRVYWKDLYCQMISRSSTLLSVEQTNLNGNIIPPILLLLFGSQLTSRYKVNPESKDSILLEYSPSSESCKKNGSRGTGLHWPGPGTGDTHHHRVRPWFGWYQTDDIHNLSDIYEPFSFAQNNFCLLLCNILCAAGPHYPMKAAGRKPLFLRNCHWPDSCHPNEKK